MRDLPLEAPAPGAVAARARYVGGAASLIDEDEACRVELGLRLSPVFAGLGHVGAVLLAHQHDFF